ncbi:helix-hairpin-helix domain-containing protein [Paenibacillus anaericanus]|uniref:Helix-hairpin-helix domain-containing protein n=1 Tax=Paenibacillus anaericanus TaxID=170367 RepID=A0A433Y9L8_9BACL|nr:helix-hairpin-helix domain-containing protein [Paenibacillus anaericanus]RUT46517.1 helix-hairpin-helix domain-containing protein [Paenibacillus anaericanus]
MKKEYMLIAVVSAIIGAGLMFVAVGGNGNSGIEGWVPVNSEVVSAMEKNVDAVDNPPGNAVTDVVKPADISKQEISDTATSPVQQQQQQSDLININTAGLAELQDIPGIGEKKAQAIVDYRNTHGAFISVSDLTKVKGIGDKMLQKMKPHIGL